MTLSRLVPALVVLSVSACASRSPVVSSEAQLDAPSATALCLRLHEQGAQCVDGFNTLLVELREKHDPRFAELLSRPGLRQQVLEEGRAEVLADGTGPLEQREARCAGFVEHGPAVPAADGPALERCYALSSCEERLECIKPVLDVRFATRAAGR